MNNVKQISTKLNKMSWIIPACFVLSCALLAAGIMLLILRGFGNMEAAWLFSIGADLYCMAVCVMLCFSCVLNFKRRNTAAESIQPDNKRAVLYERRNSYLSVLAVHQTGTEDGKQSDEGGGQHPQSAAYSDAYAVRC